MSILLENAKYLLEQTQDINPAIKQAYDELNNVTKEGSITDFISDPKFQNVINLLTPFTVNYKVNQVMKLLKDLESERTGRKKWWL